MLALGVAEGNMLFYSLTMRDLRHSVQGLMLAERHNLEGKRVFQERWTLSDRFVLEHVIGGHARETQGLDGFIRNARRGEYVIIAQPDGNAPQIVPVRANRRHKLCVRAD